MCYQSLYGGNVMNVIEAIHYRHSYRGKYKDIPIPKEDLIRIMQAGLDAPSGCNKQTTSLIAVDNPDVLKQLHSVIEPPVGETAPAAICVLTQRVNAYRDKCFAVQGLFSSNSEYATCNCGAWLSKLLV